jgi:TonB-dependent receptor
MPAAPCAARALRLFRRTRAFIGFAVFALYSVVGAAQTANEGAITGRVLNPATGDYLRHAVIRIEETGQSTTSEDGGYFRLSPVSPGTRTLVVTYTGFETLRTPIEVVAGQSAIRNIELVSVVAGAPLRLGSFVVTSEREGNARAIMEQRNSMNITNSVASEVFGDVSEGNIGEFMKHLPGVEIEFNADKVRDVRLRGLGAEYTSVTLDGVSLAGSDANAGAAGNARAFNFEQVSLSSIDSIEVLKTVSADQDANAPAGTINLRPKRAFDRKGRRIAWQANLTAFSEDLTLSRTHGPDDRRKRKILPGGSIEYSDVFFNDRLGLVLNISESNVYSVYTQYAVTHNYTATAADPRPVVPTTLNPLFGPRTNEVFATTLTADFKATPNLVLSLGGLYSTVDLWYYIRDSYFDAISRALVVGTDPLKSFRAGAGNGRVRIQTRGINKMGRNMTFLPKFEYKRGDLTVDGRFALAESKSSYSPNSWDSIYNAGTPAITGIDFEANRSHYSSSDWNVVQTAGSDWNDGRFFSTPTVIVADGRLAETKIYSGDVTATLKTTQGLPITWKTGLKMKREVRDFENTRAAMSYNYVGPGAGVGAFRDYRSAWDIDHGMLDARITSISGGNIFGHSLLDLYKLYRDNPQYFAQTITPANYYDAFIGNKKHYVEDINAAFVMGTASVGKRVILRAGLRYEDTKGDSREFDPRTTAEVRAAGYAVAAGRATTIPGIEYQYLSKPRVHRKGGYDNFFPSASFKYKLSERFDAHFGYSRTIRRPTFRDVAGVWAINDDTMRVSAPNPNLTPEISDNLSARLAYYFEPVGTLGANFFQNTVEGLFVSSEMTPEEFGYTGGLDLSNYTIISTVSGPGETVIRGMELEYSQSLSFLPRPFNGLNVRASYTRNYAEVTLPLMSGHSVKAGLSYGWRGLSVYANLSWFDNYPTNAAGTTYRRHRTLVDAGGSYQVAPRLKVFFSLRNVTNTPLMNMQKVGANPAVVTGYQSMGTGINVGLQGTF